jgi:predicted small metal-binding protein
MQKFACKDIGLNCNYTTTGLTKEETVKKALEHGMKAHADLMKSMNKEQTAQFTRQVENSIRPL